LQGWFENPVGGFSYGNPMLDFGVKIISSSFGERYIILNDDDLCWNGQGWSYSYSEALLYADFDLATNECMRLWVRDKMAEDEGA
jgi:hypothetical protein